MQKAQYQQLSRHIESVRQARHDLRQHLNVIDHYLNSGKTEELKAYIAQYRQMLPPDTFCTWCENYAVNTMVNYYVDEARKSGVDISVSMAVPQKLSMNEAEFCSVLGNLLENALDACREYTGSNPFIRLRAKEENSHLALTVDNSCSSAPVEENGVFSRRSMTGLEPEPPRSARSRNIITGSSRSGMRTNVFSPPCSSDL